jgi:hypothetical protein
LTALMEINRTANFMINGRGGGGVG